MSVRLLGWAAAGRRGALDEGLEQLLLLAERQPLRVLVREDQARFLGDHLRERTPLRQPKQKPDRIFEEPS